MIEALEYDQGGRGLINYLTCVKKMTSVMKNYHIIFWKVWKVPYPHVGYSFNQMLSNLLLFYWGH